jgi:hypothetical protein
MASEIKESDINIKLQRLWKGTLFIGVSGIYILIVSLLLVRHGWRSALLGLLFITLCQFFRYIANDVDRIGWSISNQEKKAQVSQSTKLYQKRMLYLLVFLAQFQNAALIYQTYALAGVKWAVGTAIGLLFVESFYIQIRKVNRKIEFEQASYGFRDKGLLFDGPELLEKAIPEEPKEISLDEKLSQLKEMAEQGVISQIAYENTRDQYLISRVMEQNSRVMDQYNDDIVED